MIVISKKESCTGCTACYSVCPKHAITMVADSEGFKYPFVDATLCIDCGVCDNTCPIKRRDKREESKVTPVAYAAHYSSNERVWYESASGGAFTAITDYIYKRRGIVYGAAFNDAMEVVHDSADNPSDAVRFRDSKYVQSDLRDTFLRVKNDLTKSKLVLFSGTPCQVAGLKGFLKKDFENLLTVDLICHSVPSPSVFQDYINYIQKKYGKRIVRICFKDKTLGWDKFQTPRIYFDDGTDIFNVDDSKLWALLFYSYLVVRPSCHACRFSNLVREGDITIGDFWGVEKLCPEYNVPNGASLMLLNSDKGKKSFDDISSNLRFSLANAKEALPNTLLYTTTPNPQRQKFWEEYNRSNFISVVNKYLEIGPYYERKRLIRKLFNVPFRLVKYIIK